MFNISSPTGIHFPPPILCSPSLSEKLCTSQTGMDDWLDDVKSHFLVFHLWMMSSGQGQRPNHFSGLNSAFWEDSHRFHFPSPPQCPKMVVHRLPAPLSSHPVQGPWWQRAPSITENFSFSYNLQLHHKVVAVAAASRFEANQQLLKGWLTHSLLHWVRSVIKRYSSWLMTHVRLAQIRDDMLLSLNRLIVWGWHDLVPCFGVSKNIIGVMHIICVIDVVHFDYSRVPWLTSSLCSVIMLATQNTQVLNSAWNERTHSCSFILYLL